MVTAEPSVASPHYARNETVVPLRDESSRGTLSRYSRACPPPGEKFSFDGAGELEPTNVSRASAAVIDRARNDRKRARERVDSV
jgi:hypothetical protein